ncbi:MAG: Acyltransferase family protein [Lacunisphaera sp.]|nr:Acyltransferase family protein [Lacunisphaera sp.]
MRKLSLSILDGKRNPVVDVLRGLSIALVFVSHYSLLHTLWSRPGLTVFGRDIDDIGNGMGYYGVASFFVTSGFLITGVSLRRYGQLASIDVNNFWWLRFSRIMPMLLVCAAGMTVFHVFRIRDFVFQDSSALAKTLAAIFSFRYFEIAGSDPAQASWNPLWSLSVEEIFYLVFPVTCLCLTGTGAVIWLAAAVMAFSAYMRITGAVSPFFPSVCMDLLTLGCLIAMARPERLKKLLSFRMQQALGTLLLGLGLAIIGLCVVAWHPFRAFAWAPLLCGGGAGLVLVSAQLMTLPRVVGWALLPASILGVISYEVYLLHMPVSRLGWVLVQLDGWWRVPIVIAAGILTHELFSEPINHALRRLKLGRPRLPANAGSPGMAEPRPPTAWSLGRLAILPLLTIALLAAWACAAQLKPLAVTFDSVVGPPGSMEPVAYIGKSGGADLVLLHHDNDDIVRVGIMHWGIPEVVSMALRSRELVGAELRIDFSAQGVIVTKLGQVLVRTSVPPHASSGKVVVGINDVGFPVGPKATSVIR